jgi:hypothetical protein
VLLVGFAAQAQSVPDEPVWLEIAYDLSFSGFDYCGDAEAGRIFRRLIIEKAKSCPYSDAAREKFRAHIAETTEDLLSELLQARADGRLDQLKGPPEVGPGMSCKDYLQTSAYLEQRERLMRYKRREISVDEALGENSCPSGPASL